jgi:hypothetical protein
MKNKQKAWRLGASKWNKLSKAKGGTVSARSVKALVGLMGATMRDPARHRPNLG